jgi:hypothetical protein
MAPQRILSALELAWESKQAQHAESIQTIVEALIPFCFHSSQILPYKDSPPHKLWQKLSLSKTHNPSPQL